MVGAVPVVPVVLEGLAIARSSTNLGSLVVADPAVPVVPVVPAGARWTHPVTVMVFAELELLLLCGVVCAATPTDRIMAAAADAPDRTIVLILPPLFQGPAGMGATLRPRGPMRLCMHEVKAGSRSRRRQTVDIPNLGQHSALVMSSAISSRSVLNRRSRRHHASLFYTLDQIIQKLIS